MNLGNRSLTLATYNIHSYIGSDGKFDHDRIITVIKQLDADIIALQEVTSIDSDPLTFIDYFRDQTSMRVIPGMTMFREAAYYGNIVLSRAKIDRIETIDISVKKREPRGAICLMMQVGDKRVHIIATHLGLRPRERLPQMKLLMDIFQRRPADISVLMGDLNEWHLWGQPLCRLRKHFAHIRTPATFPARLPLLPLDKILVQPHSYLQSLSPIKNSLTRTASDHLPLRAKLTF